MSLASWARGGSNTIIESSRAWLDTGGKGGRTCVSLGLTFMVLNKGSLTVTQLLSTSALM